MGSQQESQEAITRRTLLLGTAALLPGSTLLVSSSLSSPSPWEIKSVSTMKLTKDRVHNPVGEDKIGKWVDKAADLGVTHVAIETPYDNPPGLDAVSYTQRWIDTLREAEISVWHRHMFTKLEGIYDAKREVNREGYIDQIEGYILGNEDMFRPGDIFTPHPEIQNGGISLVTACHGDVCQFEGDSQQESIRQFNSWVRESTITARSAFERLGLEDTVRVGFFGFDGFVGWGHDNPDWSPDKNPIIEDETLEVVGEMTIDHYPRTGSQMAEDLDELQSFYPHVPIMIGELGDTQGEGGDFITDSVRGIDYTSDGKPREHILGMNYWHIGPEGNEALLIEDADSNPRETDLYYVMQEVFSAH